MRIALAHPHKRGSFRDVRRTSSCHRFRQPKAANDLGEYILDYYKMPCLGNASHRPGRPPIAAIVQTPKSYFCASSSKKWQTSGYHRTGPRRTQIYQSRFLFRLSYKNDGFRQIHAGGNGRSFLISARVYISCI